MDNLTLVIPAKYEKESLPSVLTELKKIQFIDSYCFRRKRS